MKQTQSTISSKHQVVVPAAVRRALNLKAGDTLNWRVIKTKTSQTKAIAEPLPDDWAEHTRGLGQAIWQEVDIDTYINELRQEWQPEA
jgi:AbrB family looped-hinge helix DNA binding protein